MKITMLACSIQVLIIDIVQSTMNSTPSLLITQIVVAMYPNPNPQY